MIDCLHCKCFNFCPLNQYLATKEGKCEYYEPIDSLKPVGDESL